MLQPGFERQDRCHSFVQGTGILPSKRNGFFNLKPLRWYCSWSQHSWQLLREGKGHCHFQLRQVQSSKYSWVSQGSEKTQRGHHESQAHAGSCRELWDFEKRMQVLEKLYRRDSERELVHWDWAEGRQTKCIICHQVCHFVKIRLKSKFKIRYYIELILIAQFI